MSRYVTHARDSVELYNAKRVTAICGVRAPVDKTVYLDSGQFYNCVGCKAIVREREKDAGLPPKAVGPERWERSADDEDNEIIHIMSDRSPDDEVCTLYGSAGDNVVRARLIVAAPEMLEALQICSKCEGLQQWGGGKGYEIEKVRAAIAKAEGRA